MMQPKTGSGRSGRPEQASSSRHRSSGHARALGRILLALGILLAAPSSAAPREPIDLDRYASLLARHTRTVDSLSGTAVDYAALARSRELDALIGQIRAARPSKLGHKARLAFWINAYNLLTLDLVRRHYPIEGIKAIGSLWKPVWRQTLVSIEGEPISLDHIEHAILRKEGEPRIHAAIVCASKSCPPLARQPFRAATLDADLDRAMRRWLSDGRKGAALDRKGNRLRVSKIFAWFEEDFAAAGGIRAVVAAHRSPADAAWLRGPGRNATIEYFDYDWSLNDR